MKVAMMQPTFMPWCGFFELVDAVDVFILLDDFQFSVQSYHQRNRLFINNDVAGWYTVPIAKKLSYGAPLNQTKVAEDNRWRKKMWKRLEGNYRKANNYSAIAPIVKDWLLTPTESLAQMNIEFIRRFCELLGINVDWQMSSGFPSLKKRSERVAELLLHFNADEYFSARGSYKYMASDGVFPLDGCKIMFQNYVCRPYTQIGSRGNNFVSNLSVLDLLFNHGDQEEVLKIIHGTEKWLSWEDLEETNL